MNAWDNLRQLGIKGAADFDQSKAEMRTSISAALDAMSPRDLRECLAEAMAISVASHERSPMIQIVINLGINEFNTILAEWLVSSTEKGKAEDGN